MFFYVYLLKSIVAGRFYVGFTNDLRSRLEKHNSGKVYWKKNICLGN